MRTTETHTLPTSWLTFLFDGDESGYTEGELQNMMQYQQECGLSHVVDYEVVGYIEGNDANSLGDHCTAMSFEIEEV